jgi:hypothetical protein
MIRNLRKPRARVVREKEEVTGKNLRNMDVCRGLEGKSGRIGNIRSYLRWTFLIAKRGALDMRSIKAFNVQMKFMIQKSNAYSSFGFNPAFLKFFSIEIRRYVRLAARH